MHAAASQRTQVPPEVVAAVVKSIRGHGPITAGQIASRLPPKQRKYTRSVLAKLKSDGALISRNGRFSLDSGRLR